MQKPLRVSSQDTVEIGGWQFQLFDKRVRVFDIPRGEEIRADHDTVRADLLNEEAQRVGIVIEIVVMESPDVLPEWTLDLQLRGAHVIEAVLDAREDERKGASAVGQDNLESREFVERSGRDELESRGGVFERKAKPVGGAGRADKARAVEVRFTIERMKEKRITQFLASREDRFKGRLEQVISLLHGIG